MKAQRPQIFFVDTTLREGLQSAVKLFADGITPAAYVGMIMKNVNLLRSEIYGPDVYFSKDDYELLVDTLGAKLQLYCGVVDNFDANKRPHIKVLQAPCLSLTIIAKTDESLNKIRSILAEYPTATLRLGMECAGSARKSTLAAFLHELASLDRVETLTISDSNGTMTPAAIYDIVSELGQPLKARLGFHLHNDRGLATANALAAIDACTAIGQRNILFECTFAGLGERYGLLSMQELAALDLSIFKSDPLVATKKVSKLMNADALNFHRLPFMKDVVHVAASHFDLNGELRPEYRHTKNERSSYGQ